jgi:hypothetical protein
MTAGWVLIAGAVGFLLAAFAPASFVFAMSDPEERRRHLAKYARSWRWGQVPFAAGAVVSAVGLLMLGVQLDGRGGTAVACAGGLATLSTVPWVDQCRLRAQRPDSFLAGALPAWQFMAYLWGTLGALVVAGGALLATDVPAWAAWLVLGWSLLLAAAWLRFRDVPPFLLYLATTALGLAVL